MDILFIFVAMIVISSSFINVVSYSFLVLKYRNRKDVLYFLCFFSVYFLITVLLFFKYLSNGERSGIYYYNSIMIINTAAALSHFIFIKFLKIITNVNDNIYYIPIYFFISFFIVFNIFNGSDANIGDYITMNFIITAYYFHIIIFSISRNIFVSEVFRNEVSLTFIIQLVFFAFFSIMGGSSIKVDSFVSQFICYTPVNFFGIMCAFKYLVSGNTESENKPVELKLDIKGRFGLSDREEEIVTLIAQGLRNDEIGKKLNISTGTVKNHLSNIFKKTGYKNRVELVSSLIS